MGRTDNKVDYGHKFNSLTTNTLVIFQNGFQSHQSVQIKAGTIYCVLFILNNCSQVSIVMSITMVSPGQHIFKRCPSDVTDVKWKPMKLLEVAYPLKGIKYFSYMVKLSKLSENMFIEVNKT